MNAVSSPNQGLLCLGTYAVESSQEPTRLCAWDSMAEAWLGTIGTKCTFEQKDVGLSQKVVLGSLLLPLAGVKQPYSFRAVRVGRSHRRGTCVHPSAQTFSKLSKIVNYQINYSKRWITWLVGR